MRVIRVVAGVLVGAVISAALTALPSEAAAPGVAQLVAPADGSVAARSMSPCRCGPVIPTADRCRCRFEGRRLGATVPGRWSRRPVHDRGPA